MANKEISLENVLRRCGDLGKFQWLHYCFLNLITIGVGITSFYYVFGGAQPSFRCQLPIDVWPNDNQYRSNNEIYQALINQWTQSNLCKFKNGTTCDRIVYDRLVFGQTFTEDGNYVCSRALKKTWLSTMYQVGGFVVLLTGYIGDRVGRRKMIQILTSSVFIIPLITQIFLQWVSMNDNIKFILLGINQLFSSIDAYPMTFLLLMELTSSSHTSLGGTSAVIGFTIGEGFITLFAYLAMNWLRLKWIITGYFAIVLPYLYFVPESPQWLFSKKKYNQLAVYLRKIAETNGKKESDWYPYYIELVQDPRLAILSSKHAARPQLQAMMQKLPRFLMSSWIGFVTMLLYINISYGLGAMNDAVSPYWNIIIGAVVEGLGYIIACIIITTRLGRKHSLMIFSLLTSICIFITSFTNHLDTIVILIISQIGKLSISAGVSIAWIFIPEVFPTSIRGVANGVFVVAGRFGAILAPILDVAIGQEHGRITSYVYTGLTILMLITIYFLPETRNRSFHTEEDEEKRIEEFDKTNINQQSDGGFINRAMSRSTVELEDLSMNF